MVIAQSLGFFARYLPALATLTIGGLGLILPLWRPAPAPRPAGGFAAPRSLPQSLIFRTMSRSKSI
jgi:hypothetical protein